MLDLHALSSGGSLQPTFGAIGTILLGGDGQSAAGVPIDDGANLINWGALTTIADTIAGLQLISQDQLDPVNGQKLNFGTSSVLGILNQWDYLPYKTGARSFNIAQVTAAANCIAYLLDYYPQNPKEPSVSIERFGRSAGNGQYSTTYGGALTALTWKQQAFSPSPLLPAGKYAIVGAWVDALTNYALIRFRHANFGTFAPGFPVVDTGLATARATVNADDLFMNNGYQFWLLSQYFHKPLCPVFNVSAQGTGLNFEMAAITADTPVVTVNLAKVG
jgi:hypothetical protein